MCCDNMATSALAVVGAVIVDVLMYRTLHIAYSVIRGIYNDLGMLPGVKAYNGLLMLFIN